MGMGLEGFAAFRQLLEETISLASVERQGELRRQITRHLTTTFASLMKALQPSRVYEIGAAEASFSAGARRWVPASEVIAVEANPAVASRYRETLEQAGVKYLNYSVGAGKGRVELSIPKRDGALQPLMTSTLEEVARPGGDTIVVEQIVLDSLADPDGGPRNVLWIDVEGAAAQVIWGGTKVLSMCDALYIELEDRPIWRGQYVDTEVASLLGQYGLKPYLCDVQRPFQFNMLFVREEAFTDATLRAQRGAYVRRVLTEVTSGTGDSADPAVVPGAEKAR